MPGDKRVVDLPVVWESCAVEVGAIGVDGAITEGPGCIRVARSCGVVGLWKLNLGELAGGAGLRAEAGGALNRHLREARERKQGLVTWSSGDGGHRVGGRSDGNERNVVAADGLLQGLDDVLLAGRLGEEVAEDGGWYECASE